MARSYPTLRLAVHRSRCRRVSDDVCPIQILPDRDHVSLSFLYPHSNHRSSSQFTVAIPTWPSETTTPSDRARPSHYISSECRLFDSDYAEQGEIPRMSEWGIAETAVH